MGLDMSKNRAAGIDLGTTYCAMATVDERHRSQLVLNAEGELLTPSVVLFDDRGVVVGKEARKVSVLQADRVAICVKRDMGKPVYSRRIRGQYLPPEVIQSYILKKLKEDLQRQLGPEFQAIITVPAYFDEPRRKATFQAGELAGLKVLDILNEPTAAALAFGEVEGYLTRFGAPKERMRVVVYDLGGGTFDVTLIDMQPGHLRTICTDGDVQLGGHDWDMRLVEYFARQFQQRYGGDLLQDLAAKQRLLLLAEETKHTLSARQKATVSVTHGGKSLEVTVTRKQFEDMTVDLLERTRHTTRQLLATAGLQWKDVHRVLLTGGSTRMPMVQRMLRELTGLELDLTVSPDEAVARGAALYAYYLLASRGETGHRPTFDITNVNAHSLGIEGIDPKTGRRRNQILIQRNTPLPARHTTECVTHQAGQTSVVIQVLEGESFNPDECSTIGRTVIRDLPPRLPKGWPIEVTYEYGVNGRLSVRAKVRGTDKLVQLELERDESLSHDRLQRWKKVVDDGGGLDAFELAVQEELDQLKKRGPSQTMLPELGRAANVDAESHAAPRSTPGPATRPAASRPAAFGQPKPQVPGQPSGAVPARPSGMPPGAAGGPGVPGFTPGGSPPSPARTPPLTVRGIPTPPGGAPGATTSPLPPTASGTPVSPGRAVPSVPTSPAPGSPAAPPGGAASRPVSAGSAMVAFTCPHCRGVFQVSAALVGQQIACPQCRGPLIVPG
jgi:molecular chaperone DnaK